MASSFRKAAASPLCLVPYARLWPRRQHVSDHFSVALVSYLATAFSAVLAAMRHELVVEFSAYHSKDHAALSWVSLSTGPVAAFAL